MEEFANVLMIALKTVKEGNEKTSAEMVITLDGVDISIKIKKADEHDQSRIAHGSIMTVNNPNLPF